MGRGRGGGGGDVVLVGGGVLPGGTDSLGSGTDSGIYHPPILGFAHF